ncbi:putative exonuclease GOR isoform X1 [Ixodes scapularis]|uniref:putative exonuclease GOR isoform X1 n=1 Tax=Ixodes scapularis TaxID=6945 RepID=UPI001A9DFBBF|nr:putative exonuclease GOR isoform X1 [Ixodes scapularis]
MWRPLSLVRDVSGHVGGAKHRPSSGVVKTRCVAPGCIFWRVIDYWRQAHGRSMADELVFLTGNSPMLVLSAVLGLLVVLIIFVAGQKRDGDDKETNETEADKQTARKENRAVPKRKKVQEKKRDIKTQYLHPWLMTTLKGHSGNILDLDFNVNGKFLATSADGRSGRCQVPRLNWQNVAGTPLGAPSPLEGAWRLPLCPDDLYHQLLCYTLTPQELHRCGYPRPCPGEPGRAVWFQVDAPGADASHRTCCRCGAAFVITAGGEYYASDACVFHSGRRTGAEFGCCGASAEEPGCERSDYHVCAQGARGEEGPARGFVRTRPRSHGGGGVYALDCEMCFTIRGLEVAKVTVVGADGATVYDAYVRPGSPVLDYNTAFSGVTAEHLRNVRTTLQDVQAVLLRLFTASTVLVGHGLENDLRGLKLVHDTVVDTAVLFPHHRGLPFRRSLRSLVGAYLNRDVQEGTHDSLEDARACMELVLWKAARDQKMRERRSRGSGGRLQPSL